MMKENLNHFISESIRKNWESTAMTDYNGKSYTYSIVADRIAKLHIIFEGCGIKPGDKIALVGKNSSHWAITYLATLTYGAVIVPILPDFRANDLQHIIAHSDSKLLFAGENIFDSLDMSAMPLLHGAVSLNDFTALHSERCEALKDTISRIETMFHLKYDGAFCHQALKFAEVSNSDPAVISYTSGTTGFTKGVIIPFNSLIANVVYANNNMPLQPGDKLVSFLPLAHAYGCAFEFLWPFTLGCHITFLTKTPSPQVILHAFREVRPRLVLSVPLVIEKIYKKQILPAMNKPVMKVLLHIPGINRLILKKIRAKLVNVFGGNFHEVVIGGAALNQEVEHFFNKIGFPFSIGYGMTECGPLISYANWDKTRLGSAGKLVDTLEVKIDSAHPFNEVGEILVRGENVMLGYYKNEEATLQALDSDGWLHTGDLGVIDADNFIYIRGRNKSMVLGPSGQNIYPEEIEARINNLEYVVESVVVEKNGRLVALIFPDFETADRRGINEEGLKSIFEKYRKQLNAQLPVFMNIAAVRIVTSEFEKTPKKSIKRFLYKIEE
ncbi:MAG TPA: AMP-binding protein [Bacteroidales bacterium]|nr:AMP-binding protein [Bacteroidales bacterium]